MRLIKKINNNFALAQDTNGENMIVEGKGIGFLKMPCDFNNYGQISRTYYNYDSKYINLIESLPTEVIDVANQVYDYLLAKLNCPLNPNLPFIMGDHINFAIERMNKDIQYTFKMDYELKQIYAVEYEAAAYALELVSQELGVELPKSEEAGIALNIINAEMDLNAAKQQEVIEDWSDQFVKIIENETGLKICRDGFNYSRFMTHISCLYERITRGSTANRSLEGESEDKIYQELIKEYPMENACVNQFVDYLQKKYKIKLDEEEKTYLLLHVNRLCSRETGQ